MNSSNVTQMVPQKKILQPVAKQTQHNPPEAKAKTTKPTQPKEYKRPLADIMADLAKPVPRRLIKTKIIQGNHIDFVPWYNYVKLLNHFCPGWEVESEIGQSGGKTTVTAKLIIHAQECSVARTGVGMEDTDLDKYGDAVSNANAQALRKACALFGLTLDLWEK